MMNSVLSRLWVRPFIIHGTAAVVTMSYNVICRSYFYLPAMNEQKLRLAGVGYFITASAAAALFTGHLVKKATSSSDFAAIPVWRAILSTCCWLGLIPALGCLAIILNGEVDSLLFPNFIMSVLLGCLIATTFTTIFYAEDLSQRTDLVWSPQLERLLLLIRAVPYIGTIVPIMVATLLFIVVQPNDRTSEGGVLNSYLIGLYTISTYGVVYLSIKARRVRRKIVMCYAGPSCSNT